MYDSCSVVNLLNQVKESFRYPPRRLLTNSPDSLGTFETHGTYATYVRDYHQSVNGPTEYA